jgi:hypothetical protein
MAIGSFFGRFSNAPANQLLRGPKMRDSHVPGPAGRVGVSACRMEAAACAAG